MIKFLKIFSMTLLGICLLLVLIRLISPEFFERSYNAFFSDIIKVKCIDYKQGIFSKKLNSKIPDYIGISSLTGIKKCKDEKEILDRVDKGELFKIRNGDGYIVEEMSHSYPYLTKEGQELLAEIGRRFLEKVYGTRLIGSRFRITSLTRTTDKLKSLREINSNTSPNSPHLYGNAIDISYLRFTTRKFFLTYCDRRFLKESLAEVIWQLREEKKCWATYEVKQSCFHVVAR